MDLFDPKPALDRHHGQAYFQKIAGEIENPHAAGALMRSPFRFARHGRSGAWVSELLPHTARHVDRIAFLLGMYTTNLTHEPAIYLAHTGHQVPGYPTLGAWVTYALGTENENLPAYVVLDDPAGLPINGVESWTAGFLPPVFQGTRFRASGAPVLHLTPESRVPGEVEAAERSLRERLDRRHQAERPGNPILGARLSAYTLAARMQLSATDALDLSGESSRTLDRYGIGSEPTDSYGRRCLIARRLVERGVRFVQLFINRQIWDNHSNIDADLRAACLKTDRPIGALLEDLHDRGLWDETLVLWGGEFGRLPIAQLPADKDEKKAGRDHNKNAMCCWMAGAGVRPGMTHGGTDEVGLAAVEGRVGVPDWHATILHLLGLDYGRVTYPHNGLDEKLTGVLPARIVREVLA